VQAPFGEEPEFVRAPFVSLLLFETVRKSMVYYLSMAHNSLNLLPTPVSGTLSHTMHKEWQEFQIDVRSWWKGWYLYVERHLVHFGVGFEARKDSVVDLLLSRRGTYQWPFLHISLIILLISGVLSAPIVASSYPGSASDLQSEIPPSAVLSTLDLAQTVQTQISEKPRDKVEIYIVKEGDTISSIAQSKEVSVDTVKWANDIKRDTLKIGQELKIPPVTGMVHKVREGDTVYTIAKNTGPMRKISSTFPSMILPIRTLLLSTSDRISSYPTAFSRKRLLWSSHGHRSLRWVREPDGCCGRPVAG